MRLVTFIGADGAAAPGRLEGDAVVSLAGAFDCVVSILKGGAAALQRAAAHAGPALALKDVQLCAPIPRPPKVICVGLNYRDHAEESQMEIPAVPTIFNKFPTAVIGPGAAIVVPRATEKPDYEAELGVVIGQGGRNIRAEDWRAHVAGYTCVNDVSARDLQMATTQWLMGKTPDTFCPIGPAIVTADEIADPHALDVTMTINGEVLQASNTRHLIFRIPDLIAHLSSVFTLETGDIISTGTPAGVGFARRPPRWLRPGDECVVRVSGVGELRNPVAAEA